jgi:hypothetical protein
MEVVGPVLRQINEYGRHHFSEKENWLFSTEAEHILFVVDPWKRCTENSTVMSAAGGNIHAFLRP